MFFLPYAKQCNHYIKSTMTEYLTITTNEYDCEIFFIEIEPAFW